MTQATTHSIERPVAWIARRLSLVILTGVFLCGMGLRLWDPFDVPPWHDEILSHSRAQGESGLRLANKLSRSLQAPGRLMSEYQDWLPAGRGDSLRSVLESAWRTPHLPLYYSLLHCWRNQMGGSFASERALSGILSIFTLLASLLLAREYARISGSSSFMIMPVFFLALSPFQIEYAREIRMYALLSLEVVLATFLLLRAESGGGRGTTVSYSAVIFCGLLTHLFFVFVPLAHLLARLRRRSLSWQAALSLLVPCLLALPMMIRVVVRGADPHHFTLMPVAALDLLGTAIWGLGTALIDIPLDVLAVRIGGGGIVLALPSLFAFGVVAWSAIRCLRNIAFTETGLLVMLPLLSTLVVDFLFNTRFSSVSRYLAVSLTMAPLAVGLVLTQAWTDTRGRLHRSLILAVAGFLLAGQVSSCWQLLNVPGWGKPLAGYEDLISIRVQLRSSPKAVLITDGTAELVYSMAQDLPAGIRVINQPLPDVSRLNQPAQDCSLPLPTYLFSGCDAGEAASAVRELYREATCEALYSGEVYCLWQLSCPADRPAGGKYLQ